MPSDGAGEEAAAQEGAGGDAQYPTAFLNVASGLARHGGDSARPLPYTHVDLGGSGTEGLDWQHGRPTAAPVVALTAWLAGLR